MSPKHNDKTETPFTVGHESMIQDIHQSLVGDPSLGNPGMVKRLEVVENLVNKHDKKFWLITVVGTGFWATVVAFKEKIFGS